VLQDLAGYRIRVQNLKKRKNLDKDGIVFMSNHQEQGIDHIPFDYKEDLETIPKGAPVFIDDGRLQLKILGMVGKRLKCKVTQGRR